MLKRIGLLCCIFWSQLATAQLVKLPNYHMKQILNDSQILDLKLSNEPHMAWLLSKHYLWKWNFVDTSLSRFSIGKGFDSAKLTISQNQKYLAISQQNRLLVFDMYKERFFHFSLAHTQGKTLAFLSKNDQCCTWIHDSGIFDIDLNLKKVKQLAQFPKVASERQEALADEQVVWSTTAFELLKLDLTSGEEKSIYRTQAPILGLVKSEKDEFTLLTKPANIRLDKNGNVIQILADVSRSNLIDLDFKTPFHAYVFSNLYLELYNLDRQKSQALDLSLILGKQAFEQLDLNLPFLLVSRKNELSVLAIDTF